MSVVSNPLIGRASGSMGNATFSTWKGINVLKTKATSVANPQSDAQVQQRSAFSQMVAIFRQLPAVVRAGFKKLAVKKSEFNAFLTASLNEAFDMSVPGIATFLPAELIISKGTIAQTAIIDAIIDQSDETIVVTFDPLATQPGQSLSDVALLAAYDVDEVLWTGSVTSALRSTGTASIALPTGWLTGDAVRVYLGFYNPLSGESDDSTNIAGVIIA